MLAETTLPIPEGSLDSPVVVWVGAIVMAVTLISMAAPRVFGPWSQVISDWSAQKRRMGEEKDDAEKADLREELEYTSRVAAARLSDIKARDAVLVVHAEWDRQMMNDPDCRPDEPPPPLWPIRSSLDTVAPPPTSQGEST